MEKCWAGRRPVQSVAQVYPVQILSKSKPPMISLVCERAFHYCVIDPLLLLWAEQQSSAPHWLLPADQTRNALPRNTAWEFEKYSLSGKDMLQPGWAQINVECNVFHTSALYYHGFVLCTIEQRNLVEQCMRSFVQCTALYSRKV